RGHRTLEITFRDDAGPAKYWRYSLNGVEVEAYQGMTPEGQPIRKEGFRLRYLLPTPHYLNLHGSVLTQFHMRPYDLSPGTTEVLLRPWSSEQTLLRVAGIRAMTRSAQGHNLEDPWGPSFRPPGHIIIGEIEERFYAVSQRVTDLLHRWWYDPP